MGRRETLFIRFHKCQVLYCCLSDGAIRPPKALEGHSETLHRCPLFGSLWKRLAFVRQTYCISNSESNSDAHSQLASEMEDELRTNKASKKRSQPVSGMSRQFSSASSNASRKRQISRERTYNGCMGQHDGQAHAMIGGCNAIQEGNYCIRYKINSAMDRLPNTGQSDARRGD